MFEGLIVDLVPYGKKFHEHEQEWLNNEASFWGSGGDRILRSKAQVRQRIEHWLNPEERRPDAGVPFGIQTKDGTPIGFVGINWYVPHHRLAMLGAKIGDPNYWGGGYGTDAVLLLIDYAFDWLDLHKVWLMTTSFNERVQRQVTRLGFKLEGRQRHGSFADGDWTDWLAYGMLRKEWPGREALIEQHNYRERWGV